ncbi:MAG: dihydroorotase [Spirochaetota bacterium]
MSRLLLKNADIVNENKRFTSDILVENGKIKKIAASIGEPADREMDLTGKLVIPGMIDDQVHFREPGLDYKGNIESESSAALAGGITSYMEMPNTKPQTVTNKLLAGKFDIAAEHSYANYSFYLGATNDNIEEIKKLDVQRTCGIKIFMGASTGNMLVDNTEALELIFQHAPIIVVTHCEDTPMILENEKAYREKYGEDVPMKYHGEIRSAEACYKSSSLAVSLAKKHAANLHVLHLTTAKEMELFTKGDLKDKKITAEVCVHHLFFDDRDYDARGTYIKWNPAIKTEQDKLALHKAVNEDRLDIIATDHAPHLSSEKENVYWKAPSGGPLVQHALLALLDLYHSRVFSLEKIVQKIAHAPADRFQVKDRGYLREGYWADLAIIDLEKEFTVSKENTLYKCGWAPFEGHTFKSSIFATILNGEIVYENGKVNPVRFAKELEFTR